MVGEMRGRKSKDFGKVRGRNNGSLKYSRFCFVNLDKILSKSKRSQVTMFVIFALMIVVILVMLFLFLRRAPTIVIDTQNPKAYIDSCVNDFTNEAVNILNSHGGDILVNGGAMFLGENISYLCYNENYYQPCVMQRPMLVEHVETEIKNYIDPKMENCFNSLKNEIEGRGFDIDMGEMDLEVELRSGVIEININRDFKMSRGDKVTEFKKFDSGIQNPLYDLLKVAMEIANQEAEYCNFDILGYMIFYPEFNLDKYRPGDSDIIYSIKDVRSKQELKIAIRSCALPPGF